LILKWETKGETGRTSGNNVYLIPFPRCRGVDYWSNFCCQQKNACL